MGREIRRVPKGWEHPQKERCPHWGGLDAHGEPGDYQHRKCFKSLYDKDFETAAREWISNFEAFQRGEHPKQDWIQKFYKYYWEYDGPPDVDYYREIAWTEAEATCYQIYETVSEGTPTSPVFETLDEMRVWLIQQGYSEKAAENFTKDGWVPSAVYTPETGFISGIEVAGLDLPKKDE